MSMPSFYLSFPEESKSIVKLVRARDSFVCEHISTDKSRLNIVLERDFCVSIILSFSFFVFYSVYSSCFISFLSARLNGNPLQRKALQRSPLVIHLGIGTSDTEIILQTSRNGTETLAVRLTSR
jgi:hypothetical protein